MCPRLVLLLVATLLAATLGAPHALAGQADVTATRQYIQANDRLVQAAWSRIASAEAVLRGVVRQVRRECPMAAANSPQDTNSEQLSNEVIGAMVTAVAKLDPRAGRDFARVAGRLTWSNRALTRTVHAYARRLGALLALAPPKLCSDVEAWAAGGFRMLPASTVAFDAQFMPAWVARGELPSALSQYETADERPVVRRTHRREVELTDFGSAGSANVGSNHGSTPAPSLTGWRAVSPSARPTSGPGGPRRAPLRNTGPAVPMPIFRPKRQLGDHSMRYYAVAEIDITDPSWVPVYVKETTRLVEQHGGRYLARTSNVEKLEGDRAAAQIYLIIEWPSKEAAEKFYESDPYKPHLESRRKGSNGEFVLVAGEDINDVARM
jgi:uncharacterized protein (DUF1330 family)